MKNDFKITVLNPKGTDAQQDFPDFAGKVNADVHAPINFHAYAACLGGSFQRDINKTIEQNRPVLLLIHRDMKYCLKVLRRLKDTGLKVAVAFRGTGLHQFAGRYHSVKQVGYLKEILTLADGVISPTQALVPFYRALRPQNQESIAFIPTPYPVDDDNWDFSLPVEKRQGIMIGTRHLKTPSRNHLLAVIFIAGLAERLKIPVGIINPKGGLVKQIVEKLGFSNNVTYIKRLKYPDYLGFMAKHRLVFQLDMSLVPGQVAGDACLCRTICVGGNSSIENLIFPEFANPNQDTERLLTVTERLLTDDAFYRDSIEEARRRALNLISYRSVAKQLRDFYSQI